jgi:hypothetical protein
MRITIKQTVLALSAALFLSSAASANIGTVTTHKSVASHTSQAKLADHHALFAATTVKYRTNP